MVSHFEKIGFDIIAPDQVSIAFNENDYFNEYYTDLFMFCYVDGYEYVELSQNEKLESLCTHLLKIYDKDSNLYQYEVNC